MTTEEISFNEAKKRLEESKSRVERAVDTYTTANEFKQQRLGMTEADYIRLTRTIQLAEKYLPRREAFSNNQPEIKKKQAIFAKLIDLYRNMAKNPLRKKPLYVEEENFPNSYIMSEELVNNLRELRHYDFLLKNLSGESKEELARILDNKLSGEVVKERKEGPGILDDYRQGSWGVERICLDGIQNHLPNDAKGTTCWLHFEVDGKWVEAAQAKLTPEKITRVRFADDGVGFTPDNLIYLHSTKTSEAESVGQFGEGMKLASMASVNLGLGLEFQSRNWSAFAVGENRKLTNTRDNDRIEERKQLIYDIKEYDGEPIVGSRTVFHTPTREFIDYALTLPEKVLDLDPNYRPEFTTKDGDIVSTSKPGQVFVKGIFVKNINSLFSYNFNGANVNPDRNEVVNFSISRAINDLILDLTDIRVMKTLMAKVLDDHKAHDDRYRSSSSMPLEMDGGENLFYQFRDKRGVPGLWREAFKQVLEQKGSKNADGTPIEAVLKTDYEVPEQLKPSLSKHNVISLPNYWALALQKAGVKTDRESLPEYMDEIIPTSLSLDYGQGIWNDERIVLDAVQNHLPSDSGGSNLFLRFQTNDDLWHDFTEFDQFADADIKNIKISDDGRGYDSKSLGLFASVKDHDVSSGKWGEGLKMLSGAAIRSGTKMVLRSRDWMAMPTTRKVTLNAGEVNEKEVDQLVFEVIQKIDKDSEILNDGDTTWNQDWYGNKREKSSTTFLNPGPGLIKEFRNIKEKVLLLQRQNAVEKIGYSEVLDFTSGKLFIRNIYIPGKHDIKYGYHFGDFDIESRDRNSIESESLRTKIRGILQKTTNERFISAFLRDAEKYAKGEEPEEYLEFTTQFNIEPESAQANQWIKVFQQDFGEKTAIRSRSDQDMNAVHTAQHLDLNMITLPDSVAKALSGLKNQEGQSITSYQQALETGFANVVMIPDEKLTDYEKFMIEHLLKYNELLKTSGNKRSIKSIKVYEFGSKKMDFLMAGFAGEGDTVNIWRTVLNGSLKHLGDVFIHEGGHALTGAKDAEDKFRDFFTEILSNAAIKMIPIDELEQARLREASLEQLKQLREEIPTTEQNVEVEESPNLT